MAVSNISRLFYQYKNRWRGKFVRRPVTEINIFFSKKYEIIFH